MIAVWREAVEEGWRGGGDGWRHRTVDVVLEDCGFVDCWEVSTPLLGSINMLVYTMR